ncbi:MAG: hypothetical protein H6993_10920 [Pseudomonadales bacterium]|nr:hypothetical protein [Pseudomonadales bacterium]MCP5184467.1 hypothetical protein [Pseudomonadales bacterium]
MDDLPVETHSGVLRSIDLDQHVLVIGGWSFYVPLDAPVTVRGAGSALSLLAVGMKVEVTYQELPEGRKAIAIDQLPDNQTLEEF